MELFSINDITTLKDEVLPKPGYFEWLKRDIKRNGLQKPVTVAKRSDGVVMLITGYALLLAVARLHFDGVELTYGGEAIPDGMIPVKWA